MATNFYSVVKYDQVDAEGQADFTIPFPYLRDRDIYVYLTDEPDTSSEDPVTQFLVRGTDWEFFDSQTVRLTTAVDPGHSLTVRRYTKKDKRLADYFDGSYLTEVELNEVTKQLLYLIQEIDDYKRIGEGTLFVPGDEDDGETSDIVQKTLDELYETAIWNTLTGLIDLVDINAEAVIRDALNEHENWSMDWIREDVMGARLDENGADIIRIDNKVETETSSLAESIELMDARVEDNESFALEFKSVYADETSAVGELTTQLNSKVEPGDLDGETGLLAETDYISGIKTLAEETDEGLTAEGEKIDSLVSRVNTHVVDEFGNIVPNSNLALVQEKAETAVTDSDANASVITQIGSAVGYTGDPWETPADFAAAVKQDWETYADSESATAKAVDTIQASTKPILFGENIPIHFNTSLNGFDFREGFPDGFPDGTVWHRRWINNGKFTTLSYVFYRGRNQFTDLEGIDPVNPAPYAYFIQGNDGTDYGTGHGIWVSEAVSAVGALIREQAEVDITEDSASASLTQLVQTSLDNRVGGIEQTVHAYLGTDEDDDGYVDLQYAVRMNTSMGSDEPVAAGFGLGLEGNPGNVTSNFAVIADHFSVSAPPEFGSLEDGQLDPAKFVTPFIIDTATGNVMVNGDLFVSDNLHAYEGRMRQVQAGRVVLGQMTDDDAINPDWNTLVDQTAYRLELLSSTDNMWSDVDPNVDRDYLLWAGSGSLTQNNGVFWVDSNGNAFFGGLVQAANVSGQMSNAFYHKHSEDPWLPAGTSWTSVGAEKDFTLTTNRSLSALIKCTFNMLHGHAGEVRIRVGINNGSGGYNWYSGPASTWTMPKNPDNGTFDGRQAVVSFYCPPDHTYPGIADAGSHIRVQPQIRDTYGHPHECGGYQMEVLALPGTVSYSEGNGTPGSDGGTSSGDESGNDDGGVPPGDGGGGSGTLDPE